MITDLRIAGIESESIVDGPGIRLVVLARVVFIIAPAATILR